MTVDDRMMLSGFGHKRVRVVRVVSGVRASRREILLSSPLFAVGSRAIAVGVLSPLCALVAGFP